MQQPTVKVVQNVSNAKINARHAPIISSQILTNDLNTQDMRTCVPLALCNAGADSMDRGEGEATMQLCDVKAMGAACLVAGPLPNAAQSNAAVGFYFCRQLFQGFDLPLCICSRTWKQQHRAHAFLDCQKFINIRCLMPMFLAEPGTRMCTS